MMNFVRQHLLAVIAGGVVALGVIAWLAFGYFGVHTLFFDETVSEAAPTFDQPTTSEPGATGPTTTTAPVTTTPAAAAPADAGSATTTVAPAPATVAPAPTTVAAPTTTDAPAEIVTEYSGSFVSDAHPTSGTAVVLGNGTGQRFLRFENFETDNGPDLNVYLVNSSTGDGSDFIDLGNLKGNVGEQNYEIPSDVDLSRYDQVSIWCVRFSVGFGHAGLAAA